MKVKYAGTAAQALAALIATSIGNAVVAQTCATDGSDYSYTETISTDGETRQITTTFCPNHPYSIINPNPPIKSQSTYSVPARPIYTGGVTSDLTAQGGLVGVMFSGAMIFSPYGGSSYGQVTSQANSATVAEGDTFDQCGGHASSSTSASYHYHLAPPCLLQQLGQTSGSHSPQIGWAADGFPVYGPFGPGGTLMQTCTVTGGTYGTDVCTNDNGGYLLTDSTIDDFTFRYYFIGETNDGFQCGYVANTTPYPGSQESTYPNTPIGYYGCCPTGATCTASFLPACTSTQTTPGYTYTTATAAYPTGLSYNTNACDTAAGQTDAPSTGVPTISTQPSSSAAPTATPTTSVQPTSVTANNPVPNPTKRPAKKPTAAVVTSSLRNAPQPEGKDGPLSSERKDIKVIRLQPQFTLVFFDGHQEDKAPSSPEISSLWQRTKDFINDLMTEKYGIHFLSAQVSEIIRNSYQLEPRHQFELSFALDVTLDASTVVRSKGAGGVLTNKSNLKRYVGKYARYSDDKKMKKNGVFFYTHEVVAKIVVKGMTSEQV